MVPSRPNGLNSASSHKTNYIDLFQTLQILKGFKLLYWFKSYGDFAEWTDFAYWWSSIRKGLCLQSGLVHEQFCDFYITHSLLQSRHGESNLWG